MVNESNPTSNTSPTSLPPAGHPKSHWWSSVVSGWVTMPAGRGSFSPGQELSVAGPHCDHRGMTDWDELLKDLQERRDTARAMGGSERLEQHLRDGRLDARARIDRLLDDDTFVELGTLAERRLCGAQRKVNVAEAADRPEMTVAPLTPALPPVAPPPPALNPAVSVPVMNAAPAVESIRPAGGAVVAALPAPVTVAPPAIRATGPSAQDMARTVQLELYRLGCGSSSADGKWNSAAREGLRRFSRAAHVKLDLEAPSDATVAALQKHDGRVCPLECGHGMQAHGNTCVAIKREPPPRSRKAERPQRRRHEAVEAAAAPAAPPPAASPPVMMGPFGGGFGGGGMMFFGMGRRH